jgi:hypothetical protein
MAEYVYYDFKDCKFYSMPDNYLQCETIRFIHITDSVAIKRAKEELYRVVQKGKEEFEDIKDLAKTLGIGIR